MEKQCSATSVKMLKSLVILSLFHTSKMVSDDSLLTYITFHILVTLINILGNPVMKQL